MRGCGPFYGLGPEFFRVAVRSVEEGGSSRRSRRSYGRSRPHPGWRPRAGRAFRRAAGVLTGGERVLYVATAIDDGDEDLQRRIRLHRERRPRGWGTLEIGVLDEVLNAAEEWDTVLLDSLTLWVSARDEPALPEFDRFLTRAEISTCLS